MQYFRLRDIKTPPFAYVVNREEAVKHCGFCMLPFQELKTRLDIEIFTTDPENWRQKIEGRPIMAEHWIIGDQSFVKSFQELVGPIHSEQVNIVSWLTRSPMAKPKSRQQDQDAPPFYRVWPKAGLSLEPELARDFPAVRCQSCGRAISDVPFDLPLAPDTHSNENFAYLRDFHLEGYDYLFAEDKVPKIKETFPELILEPIAVQPNLF